MECPVFDEKCLNNQTLHPSAGGTLVGGLIVRPNNLHQRTSPFALEGVIENEDEIKCKRIRSNQESCLPQDLFLHCSGLRTEG